MQTLEQFDKDVAEKRAKLATELAIAAVLPVPAERVGFYGGKGCEPWITYKVDTIAEALALAAKFGKLRDVSAIESGCLSIQPIGTHSKDYAGKAPKWALEECIELRQNGGRGFYTAEIRFWPAEPACMVHIKIKNMPWAFRARIEASYSQHGEVSSARFIEPDAIKGCYAQRVKFSGGSADAFDYRLYWEGLDGAQVLLDVLDDLKKNGLAA